MFGQSLRAGKVVHMKERVEGSHSFVVLRSGSHDDGENLSKHNYNLASHLTTSPCASKLARTFQKCSQYNCCSQRRDRIYIS